MKLRFFLFNLLFCSNVIAANTPTTEHTIDSLHEAIQSQKLTCESLIQTYLDRIKKHNFSVKEAAPLNAFTTINVSAITQARQLDHHYAEKKRLKGPLHCIPIVLKDNIDTTDMTTTSGSFALLGTQPLEDAFLVKQLKNAGAIIIGKGGMDELANGMYGISSRNGRMGNAYQPNESPGGSSGGSAIAVSADFAVIGIGTDNSGSVRIPAAFNGIFGLRPSTGLISQRGIFPAGNLDGIAGPLARNVTDLARLLDVIALADRYDSKTKSVPRVKTYTKFLNKNGLRGKRIGIVTKVGDVDTFKDMPSSVTMLFKEALAHMQSAGAIIVQDVQLPQFMNSRHHNVAGMREDVESYLKNFPATRSNFREICQSNRTQIYGSEKDCLTFVDGIPVKFGREYQQVLDNFNTNKTYVEIIMHEKQLDALLMPISTKGTASYERNVVNTWRAPIASNAGLPAIAFPIGYSDNMPVGIELIGKQYTEGILIGMAYAYEKTTPTHLPVTLPPINEIVANFSLDEINHLITLLGSDAYERVLKNEDRTALTAARFKTMTEENISKMVEYQKRT